MESPKEPTVVVNVNNNYNSQRGNEDIYDSFVYQCQVDEWKKEFNFKGFEDKAIKKAALEAKGDVNQALNILMNLKK